MEAEKVIVTENGNSALNAALISQLNNAKGNPLEMMAILNNNGINGNSAWWIMFMFLMWGQNGWGGNGNNANALNINDQLNAIRTQISNTNNTDLLNQAINGNQAAITQLSQTIGANQTAISTAICNLQGLITQVGGKVDFNSERVINAANMGFNSVNQTILTQAAQGRLENCQQTNALQTAVTQASTNIGIGMAQGFNDVKNLIQMSMQNNNQNTQKILDNLSQQTIQDLRDKLAKSENEKLLEAIKALKPASTTGS